MTSASALYPREPYKGLSPFRFSDREIFFERRQEKKELIRLVIIRRAVLLFGESGAGKSSLVNAGLLPLALEEGLAPIRLRVGMIANSELTAERIALGDTPEDGFLATTIVPELADKSTYVASCEQLEARVRDNPQSSPTPLLIFDQFEEFITLFEEATDIARHTDAVVAHRNISDMVIRLAHDPVVRVKLLFVFREEYLARFHDLFIRCPQLLEQQMRLVPPHAAALENIIAGPFRADKVTAAFPRRALSPAVIEDLVAAFSARNSMDQLNLSEIQVVCLRLWRSDNPQSLLAKRKVSGLIEDFLSEAMETLPPDCRDAAISILTKLVTRAGTRHVAAEEHLTTLIYAEENLSPRAIQSAFHHLVSSTKLVRKECRRNSFFYEIVSEFLIPWIKQQQQKRDEFLQARKWKRRVLIGVGLTTVLLVPFIWAAHSSTYKKALADHDVEVARGQEREAEKYAKDAKNLAASALAARSKCDAELADKTIELNQAQLAVRAAKADADEWGSKYARLDQDQETLTAALATERQKADSSARALSVQTAQAVKNADSLQSVINTLKAKNVEMQGQIQLLIQAQASRGLTGTNEASGILNVLVGEFPANRAHRGDQYVIYVDRQPITAINASTAFSARIPTGEHLVCVADTHVPCDEKNEITVKLGKLNYLKVLSDAHGRFYRPVFAGYDAKDFSGITFNSLDKGQ